MSLLGLTNGLSLTEQHLTNSRHNSFVLLAVFEKFGEGLLGFSVAFSGSIIEDFRKNARQKYLLVFGLLEFLHYLLISTQPVMEITN